MTSNHLLESKDDRIDTVNNREMVKKGKKNQGRNTEQETGMRQLIHEIKKLVLETVETTKKNLTERTTAHSYRRLSGCRVCQEAQLSESCRHCGQEGHLSRGCQRSRSSRKTGEGC